jgi:hypothetical protein
MVEPRVVWHMLHSVLGHVGALAKVSSLRIHGDCLILTSVGFAIGENKAILAALIGSFDFKPVGGKEQKVDIMYGVTARIVGGLKVDVTLLDDW